MASLATVLSEAIAKVSTMEPYNTMEFATAEEARDNFTAALLYELGLGPKPAAVHAPVAVPKEADEPAKKAPKKRAAKKTTEAVVAEAAVAVLEQVKVPEVEALVEQMGQMALEEQPKPKKARKSKETPASSESETPGPKPKAPHMGAGAGVPPPEDPVANAAAAPAAPKKKPGPKPKAKVEGANLEKLTPTQKKHLKAASVADGDFTAWANGMAAEEWKAKTVDEHIRSFLEGMKPASPKVVETEFMEVEFNGKDYLIDPKTRFIYESTADGTVKTKLGVVGKTPFEEMEV